MARSLEEIQEEIDLVQKEKDAIEKRIQDAGIYSPEEIARMYSLDPKAAEFFANKQINEDRAASMALRAAAAGKNKEATLEQKTRLVQTAQNREKANYDKAVADFGINSPQAQRSKKAFDELTIELGSTDPSVNNAYARAGQIVPREVELDEVESIKEAIKNATFDASGVLEDRDTIINSIEDWRLRNQIPVTDPTYKGLIELLKAKETGSITTEKGKQAAEKEAQRIKELNEKTARDYEEEYGQLAKQKARFEKMKAPTTADKRKMLNVILRKETGAAIASDEFRNMLMGFLSDGEAEGSATKFASDWDNLVSQYIAKGTAFVNALGQLATIASKEPIKVGEVNGLVSLVDKYTKFAQKESMIDYASDMLPGDYNDVVEVLKKSKDKSEGTSEDKSDDKPEGTTNGPTIGTVKPDEDVNTEDY